MKSRIKNKTIAISLVSALTLGLTSTTLVNALSTNVITITNIPANVVKAEVTGSDTSHVSMNTKATATLSNGTAKVENITDAGYYYVTFYTNTAEVGIATFYVGESGQSYSYGYEVGTEEKYTKANSFEYEAYPSARILDISGSNTVTFENVNDSAVSANISVAYSNNDYGDMTTAVSVNDGSVTITNIGGEGYYGIYFMDSENNTLNYGSFTIDEKNELYTYEYVFDDVTCDWIEDYVPADVVSVEDYNEPMIGIGANDDETIESFDVTISGISSGVTRVDIQCNDLELNQMIVEPSTSINGKSATIGNLYSGCYYVNFYNASDDVVGFSKFYIDYDGSLYDFDFIDNEPQLTPITSIKYSSVTAELEYQFGNTSVSIYDVPSDVDNIECYYIYGTSTDETLFFEPEYSSTMVKPFKISKLGQSGDYKVIFYKGGDVVGYATFSIDASGNICETEYVYNDKTGKWETTLVNSDEIYFYENTDIEDADDYSYGSTKLTITNVPSNAKNVIANYYYSDDTFTFSERFFPNFKISSGVLSITNLGQPGYYEFTITNEDESNNLGYVYVYVDDNMATYLVESSINADLNEIETQKTKTNTIQLSQYLNGYVDYKTGTYTVNIDSVPNVVNNILVTVVGEDDYYSSFEKEIAIGTNNVAKLDKLGMNGHYTVVFMVGNDIVGASSFYLKDGNVYNATYSGNYELTLTVAKKVEFIRSDDATTFEKGDVDLNGEVTIADTVLLQKYLLNAQSINMSQFNISDMDDNGSVDVFDLCFLKGKFIK